MTEQIILVDENNKQIGSGEKLDVHKKGLLHRGFSIFIFNSKEELLLQKRAKTKYHCGGLWSNTCCGHPRTGESLETATKRRLKEEMGFECALKEVTTFTYKAAFENGLTENEFLHVIRGKFDGVPQVNHEEADDWKWMNIVELKRDMQKCPEKYTYWFKLALEKFS